MKAEKNSLILTEMNVTKKWTDLKEAWVKEKENLHQNATTCTCFIILRFRGALTLHFTLERNKKSMTDFKTKSIY